MVAIILAAAHGFISPFIKDIKKQTGLIAEYEKDLAKFLTTGPVSAFFAPHFRMFHLTDKEDFTFETSPLTYLLRWFNFKFQTRVL